MSAFFTSIQAYFAAALAYVAQLGCIQWLLSTLAYFGTVLITTFGLGATAAMSVVYALFAVVVVALLYGTYKLVQFITPVVSRGFAWVKSKVTGLFSKNKTAAA